MIVLGLGGAVGHDPAAALVVDGRTVAAAEKWKSRIPEVVHQDGTARPQIVTPLSNRRYYELLEKFAARTHLPVLLNTSLNRRGEPMVCSPDDALNMFFGSDLQNLAIGDFLVSKTPAPC